MVKVIVGGKVIREIHNKLPLENPMDAYLRISNAISAALRPFPMHTKYKVEIQ